MTPDLLNGTEQEIPVSIPEDAGIQPEAKEKAAAKDRRRRRRVRALRSFLLRLVSLALVIYILFFHLVGLTFMPSRDMYPRLDAGDLLLFYRIERSFKAQDIVVIDKQMEADTRIGEKNFVRKALDWLGFRDPEAPKTQRFVCRVIAAPGDTVEITDERGLSVNGNAVIESNIFYPTRPYEEGITEYPLKLQDGEYFVMADQRNGGMDSRYFGVVRSDEIQGIVITILRRSNL
jgi:signal peptidase I